MTKEVVLYLRTSRKGQHTENQVQPIEQFCKNRGYQVVKVYSENESAFLAGHQAEWAQLMHDAEARRFEVVVCWAWTEFQDKVRRIYLDRLRSSGSSV